MQVYAGQVYEGEVYAEQGGGAPVVFWLEQASPYWWHQLRRSNQLQACGWALASACSWEQSSAGPVPSVPEYSSLSGVPLCVVRPCLIRQRRILQTHR